jgi:hypothetical protein
VYATGGAKARQLADLLAFCSVVRINSTCSGTLKSGQEIRCQFIILARKDELTPDFRHPN